jgi:hypothetical protein
MTYFGSLDKKKEIMMNFEKKQFKMGEKFKMAARNACTFEILDSKTSIHKKYIVEVTFFQNFKMAKQFKMAPPATILYFRVLHSHFSTDFITDRINQFWTNKALPYSLG